MKYTYNQDNKTEYYGEVNSLTNEKEGRGIQIWGDGSKYSGYWIKNKASIKGKFIYSDGSEYEGEMSKGHSNGIGKYINSSG